MGWAFGQNFRGEEIGYGVPAVCSEPGCSESIDKGLAYCCGGLEGVDGEAGCGHYFCGEHLWYGEAHEGQLCERCLPLYAEAKS